MNDTTALFDVGERVPGPRKDASAQGAVETVVDEACRTLHLPTIRSRFEDIAATALKERASYKDFLADLLEAECLQREERKKTRLVREANFPRPKRLELSGVAATESCEIAVQDAAEASERWQRFTLCPGHLFLALTTPNKRRFLNLRE